MKKPKAFNKYIIDINIDWSGEAAVIYPRNKDEGKAL